LPSDYHEFASQFQGKLKTFIIKPEGSAQGRGIFLVQTADQVPSDEQLIAQKYVTKPYLLDGLKFDLRVYVLVAGCDPLRVYVYKDGLARFATSDYCPPSKKNLANTFMHLTNYAINKHNPEFKENAIDGEKEEGHKKSLRFVFDRMKAQGVDIDEVWKQIKLIAVKTLCVAQPQLAHCYHTAQPDDQHNHMCFELLGLDILITSDGRPLLLEVNHTPSFSTGSPLDSQVKGSCIADCLRIMRVSTDSRAALVSLEKKARQARVFTGKRARLGRTERGTALAELQRERDEYVRQHLGNFEEVFPCAESFHDEPVEAFLKAALEEYELATGVVSRKECASPLSPLHGGLAASLHMRSASVVEEKVATGKAGAKDDSKVEARFRQPNQPAHARPSEMPPHAFYSYTRATSNEQVSPSSRPAYHIALPTSVKSKKSSVQLKHLQQSVSHSSFKHKDESVRERDTSKTEGHLDRLIESTTGTRLAEKNIVQRGSLLFKNTTPMVNIEMVFLLHPALEFQKRWTSACCPQRSSVPSRPLARHHAY
jgi:tubulin polyglutamylase TTLL6/13